MSDDRKTRSVSSARSTPPEDGRTTLDALGTLLEHIESRIPKTNSRLVPSSFDPHDPKLRAFPRPVEWSWTSCELALRIFGSRGVMVRLPLFWQVESPLHAVCRVVGAPIFINEPGNMPLGAAAIRGAGINIVITEAQDSFTFSTFLDESVFSFPSGWILVHRSSDATWDIPLALQQSEQNVAQEVHLFPGVPILEQCSELVIQKTSTFHLSDEYIWETSADSVLITSAGDDPLPLVRLAVPFFLRSLNKCSCGKEIVEKTV